MWQADPIPFDDGYFDAISCCQTFEHFTHSHLPPLLEMKRKLAPGRIIEIDVPNAGNPPDKPKVPEVEFSKKEVLREEVEIYRQPNHGCLEAC